MYVTCGQTVYKIQVNNPSYLNDSKISIRRNFIALLQDYQKKIK